MHTTLQKTDVTSDYWYEISTKLLITIRDRNQKEFQQLILEIGKDNINKVKTKSGNTILTALFSYFKGDELAAKFKWALDQGVSIGIDINGQDELGNTSIIIAVEKEESNTITQLLEHGADPNIANYDGVTPLFCAVENGNDDICATLYNNSKNKASPLYRTNSGENAFTQAVQMNKIELCRYFFANYPSRSLFRPDDYQIFKNSRRLSDETKQFINGVNQIYEIFFADDDFEKLESFDEAPFGLKEGSIANVNHKSNRLREFLNSNERIENISSCYSAVIMIALKQRDEDILVMLHDYGKSKDLVKIFNDIFTTFRDKIEEITTSTNSYLTEFVNRIQKKTELLATGPDELNSHISHDPITISITERNQLITTDEVLIREDQVQKLKEQQNNLEEQLVILLELPQENRHANTDKLIEDIDRKLLEINHQLSGISNPREVLVISGDEYKEPEDNKVEASRKNLIRKNYSTHSFLEERDIEALAQAEYAVQTNQELLSSISDFSLRILDDLQLIESNPEALAETSHSNVRGGINMAASGHPTFFAVSNKMHWSIIVLLPLGTNGEIEVFYMNSAYGRGAEKYYGCKLVGLEYCKNIVNQINDRNLADGTPRPAIIAKHLFLEPTQQIGNNCGAVAGLNIASIAAWFKARNPGSHTLAQYLAGLKYNEILANANGEEFELYVRSRFLAIDYAEGIPLNMSFSSTTSNLVRNIALDEVQYEQIATQITRDQQAIEQKYAEKDSSDGSEFEIQKKLLEYYARLKEQQASVIGELFQTTTSDIVTQQGIKADSKEKEDELEFYLGLVGQEVDYEGYEKHLKQANELLVKGENDEAEDHYAEALKIVQDKRHAGKQVDCLKGIALVYLARKDYTKTIALYNAALVRCKLEDKNDLIILIKAAERAFLLNIVGAEEPKISDYGLDIEHQKRVKKLQDQCEIELNELDKWWKIEETNYPDNQSLITDNTLWLRRAQLVKNIYDKIDREYKSFIKDLIQECHTTLGEPHCEYAVIGLGSLARGEATPYSDFEWAILIEDEEEEVRKDATWELLDEKEKSDQISRAKERNEHNKDHFRNLTNLLHIKILNLGQTILPSMAIKSLNNFYSKDPLDNWFFDDITPRGIAFDGAMPGACKTPLGEKDEYGHIIFELIVTPKELSNLKFMTNNKSVANVLNNITLISGTASLLNQYNLETIKTLTQIEESGLAERKDQILNVLENDIDKYDLKINETSETGMIYDVKKDLYRFPTIMIDGLAQYFNIGSTQSCARIEELAEKHIISPEAKQNLFIAVNLANELRLRTYLTNTSQSGKMLRITIASSYNPETNSQQDSLQRTNRDLLFRFYYTLLPLQERLIQFCEEKDINVRDRFLWTDLFDVNNGYRGLIHKKLLEDEQAVKYFSLAISTGYPKNTGYMICLGLVLDKLGRFEQAEKIYLEVKDLLSRDQNNIDFYSAIYNLGTIYNSLEKYQKAMDCYNEALEIIQTEEGLDYAGILNNMGNVYKNLSSYHKAYEFHKKAYEIRKDILGQYNPDVLQSLRSLTDNLIMSGQYDEALENYQQIVKICEIKFGKVSSLFADILTEIAYFYNITGEYSKSNQLYDQAIKLYSLMFGPDYIESILCLRHIATNYAAMHNYEEAFKYFDNSIAKKSEVLGEDSIEVANDYNDLGLFYLELDNLLEAEQNFQKALSIQQSKREGVNHKIASTLGNFGNLYDKKTDYVTAITYHNDCLNMLKSIFGEIHLEVANSYNNIAASFYEQKNYPAAIENFTKAKNITVELLGINHILVIEKLSSLALVYKSHGDIAKTIDCHEQILAISVNLHGEDNYDAGHYNFGLGDDYIACGYHELAVPYYRKAYEIFRNHLGDLDELTQETLDDLISILNELIQQKYQIEDLQSVIEYSELLKNYTINNANIYHNLGCFYAAYSSATIHNKEVRAQLCTKAEQNFIQAINLENTAVNNVVFANFLYQNGRYGEAEQILFKSSGVDDNQLINYSRVESSAIDQSLRQEVNFHGAITLTTQQFHHYLLVRVCVKQRKLGEAELHLNKFAKEAESALAPDSLTMSLVGYTCMELKEFDRAASAFKKAIELHKPTEVNLNYSLAQKNMELCRKLALPNQEILDQSASIIQRSWRGYNMSNLDEFKLQDLRPVLLSNGVSGSIIRIAGDNNCLFRAIVERYKYLERGIPDYLKDHERLRASVVEELKQDRYRHTIISTLSDEKEIEEINITDRDIEAYINKMSQIGSWGGAPEIIAIANILKIRILVHRNGVIIKMPQGTEFDELPDLIEILHEQVNIGLSCALTPDCASGNHYNLVVETNLARKIINDNRFSMVDSITKNHKLDDLNKLDEISKLIDKFILLTSFSNEAIEFLEQIGSLASRLEYNDAREGKEEYIRNKYGAIDRSNSAKKREGGLEIIHLAALEKIAGKINKEVVNVAFDELKNDLETIKSKISIIFEAERGNPTKTLEKVLEKFKECNPTTNLTSFVGYFYSKEIVEELINVLEDEIIKHLDFTKREDRYYFGRVLSLTGELSKDLKDFVNPGKENALFSFLKKIRDNKMAHSYSVMVNDIDERQDHGLQLLRSLLTTNFKKIVGEIKTYLDGLIITSITTTTESQTVIWTNIQKCVVDLGILREEQKTQLNKLLKTIFARGEDVVEEEILAGIQLRNLPTKIEEEISKEREETAKQKTVVVKDASGSLDVIIKKIKTITRLKDSKIPDGKNKKESKRKDLADKIKTEIGDLILAYNKAVNKFDEFIIPNDDQIPSLYLLETIQTNLKESEAGASVVEKNLKEKESLITFEMDEDDKKKIGGIQEIKTSENKSEEQARLKKQIADRLTVISKELAYIINIINDQTIDKKKKSYVIEFGYTKIGQMFKDIEKKERTLLEEIVPPEFSKSMEVTEGTRHKLMHDILARRKMPDFSRTLFRHTLPILPEIEAVKEVLLQPTLEETILSNGDADSLFKLGRAFTVLHSYDRAVECFENMFKICEAKITLIGDSITPEDEIKLLAGIFNAHFGIAEAYGKAGDNKLRNTNKKEANELYQYKIIHLEKYIELALTGPQDILHKQLASAYNNLANTYSDIGDFDNAVENHKKAIALLEQQNTTDVKKEALYLANLGATYTLELKQRMHNAFERKQDITEDVKRMQLAVACLWEAKEGYDKANISAESGEYIQVTSLLILALLHCGDHVKLLYAQELFSTLSPVLERFPVRENAPEIITMDELNKCVIEASALGCTAELLDKFTKNRELVDTEFELERINYLQIFYIEMGVCIPKNLNDRLSKSLEKLATYDLSKVSLETKFHTDVNILNSNASILLRGGNPKEALRVYLAAHKKLISGEYNKFIPDVMGDLLESIGDTYLALNKPVSALQRFEQSLEQHINHGPKERAFYIPQKILELNMEPKKDFIKRCQEITVKALESFKKKVSSDDTRLNPIKRVLAVIYYSQGDYMKTFEVLKEIDEKDYTIVEAGLQSMVLNHVKDMGIPDAYHTGLTLSDEVTRKSLKKSVNTKPTTLQDIILQKIDEKIVNSYKNCLIDRKGKITDEMDVEITIRGLFQEHDILKYMKDHLGLDQSSLTYDTTELYISLDKKARDKLSDKIEAVLQKELMTSR